MLCELRETVLSPCLLWNKNKEGLLLKRFVFFVVASLQLYKPTVMTHHQCFSALFSVSVIDLSLDVIADLAHHPNIIAIKESGGDVSIERISL